MNTYETIPYKSTLVGFLNLLRMKIICSSSNNSPVCSLDTTAERVASEISIQNSHMLFNSLAPEFSFKF